MDTMKDGRQYQTWSTYRKKWTSDVEGAGRNTTIFYARDQEGVVQKQKQIQSKLSNVEYTNNTNNEYSPYLRD